MDYICRIFRFNIIGIVHPDPYLDCGIKVENVYDDNVVEPAEVGNILFKALVQGTRDTFSFLYPQALLQGYHRHIIKRPAKSIVAPA